MCENVRIRYAQPPNETLYKRYKKTLMTAIGWEHPKSYLTGIENVREEHNVN